MEPTAPATEPPFTGVKPVASGAKKVGPPDCGQGFRHSSPIPHSSGASGVRPALASADQSFASSGENVNDTVKMN